MWLPLDALGPDQLTLDASRVFFNIEETAKKPAYRYRLAPAEPGAIGELLWLDPDEPFSFRDFPSGIEPAAGPQDQPYRFRTSDWRTGARAGAPA